MLHALALSAFIVFAALPAAAQGPEPIGMVDQPCPAWAVGRSPALRAYAAASVGDTAPDPKVMASAMAELGASAQHTAWSEKNDWANLCLYSQADAEAIRGGPVKVVFLGDSITELWAAAQPEFFTGGVVGRGISGQTSPQTLLRMGADVVALHPKAVHIMIGTNDVAGNTGPSRPEDYKANIRAMVAVAKANRIHVILASIPPAGAFPWRKSIAHPAAQIAELNAWLKAYAAQEGLTYVDYFSALATPAGAMKPALTRDGVHPLKSGYAVMRPLAEAAIAKAAR